MVQDFGLKLKVTALALGCETQKELYRRFHQNSSNVSFEPEIFYKWVQGKSTPRASKVYEDWAQLLALDQSLAYLKSCSLDEFVEALREPYGLTPEMVAEALGLGPVESSARTSEADEGPTTWQGQVQGCYVCYSSVFTQIEQGKLIRGMLVLPEDQGDPAAYRERTPYVVVDLRGPMSWHNRLLCLDLHDDVNDCHLHLTLARIGNPNSVLTGHMTGPSMADPIPRPTVTRLLAVRVPAFDLATFGGADGVIDPGEHSISAELASLGLGLQASADLDDLFIGFLQGQGSGFDQISAEESAQLNLAINRPVVEAARQEFALDSDRAKDPVLLQVVKK